MFELIVIGCIIAVIVFVFQNLTLNALLIGIIGGIVVTFVIFAIMEFIFKDENK
jgi:NADH:ubiquinone oxidoreductase subunit 6 (subunit J)